MKKEEILQLHPDPEIAYEIAVDDLNAKISDAVSVLESASTLSVVTPRAISFKENCRQVLNRISAT